MSQAYVVEGTMINFKSLTKDDLFRLSLFVALQLFNFFSLVYFTVAYALNKVAITRVLYCVVAVLFFCAPTLVQKWLKFKMATPVYVFVMIYALCPMLGHSYELYYIIKWWDKLLHFAGGIIFAIFGAYLPKVFLKKDDCNIWLCAAFGIAFSMAISVFWEFFEFAMDSFLGTDMQKDTLIFDIRSYLLNDVLGGILGEMQTMEGVTTTINGVTINGYIDVGRTDTMMDMLVETLGAIVYAVILVIEKGKYTSFHILEPKEERKNNE